MGLRFLEIWIWEFFLDELVVDGAERAAVDAFEAADAFRAVGSFVNFDIHRAVLPAFVAKSAFVVVDSHTKKADLVE